MDMFRRLDLTVVYHMCLAGEYDDGSNVRVLTVMMDMFLMPGSTVCTVCDAGTYDDGSNACTDCDGGYVSECGWIHCMYRVCLAGTYDDGSNTCTDCDDGYISRCRWRQLYVPCVQQESMMMAAIYVLTVMMGTYFYCW